MTRNEFTQQLILALMADPDLGKLSVKWCYKKAVEAAEWLHEIGLRFDPEEGEELAQANAATALLKKVADGAYEKQGLAGFLYIIDEETFAEIKNFVGAQP